MWPAEGHGTLKDAESFGATDGRIITIQYREPGSPGAGDNASQVDVAQVAAMMGIRRQ